MYFLRIAPQPWGVWLGRYEQRPMSTVCSIFVIPEPASNVLHSHLSAAMGSRPGRSGGLLGRLPCAVSSSSREPDVVVMMHQSPQAMYFVHTPPQPPWGVGWGGVAKASRSPDATPADSGATSRSRCNQQQGEPGMRVTASWLSRSDIHDLATPAVAAQASPCEVARTPTELSQRDGCCV